MKRWTKIKINKIYENENNLSIFLLKATSKDWIYISIVHIICINKEKKQIKYYNLIML